MIPARDNDTSVRPTSLYWGQLPENLEGEAILLM